MKDGASADPLATLDLASLERALMQLAKALRYAESEAAKADVDLFEQFRQSVVQAFEYTFELTRRMIERFLRLAGDIPDDAALSFNEIIRVAIKVDIVNDRLEQWMLYRERRNITSHTYDDAKAQAVFEAAPLLLDSARCAVQTMRTRIARVQ